MSLNIKMGRIYNIHWIQKYLAEITNLSDIDKIPNFNLVYLYF